MMRLLESHNSTIAEGQKKGTLIGTLGAVDQDASAGDKFSYTLVSGVGDSDNASFKISGAELKSNNPLMLRRETSSTSAFV